MSSVNTLIGRSRTLGRFESAPEAAYDMEMQLKVRFFEKKETGCMWKVRTPECCYITAESVSAVQMFGSQDDKVVMRPRIGCSEWLCAGLLGRVDSAHASSCTRTTA